MASVRKSNETADVYTLLDRARSALKSGSKREIVESLGAVGLGYDALPTRRQLERIETMRHGPGLGPPIRSTTQALVDRFISGIQSDRHATAPEIDLSPDSPKLAAMDVVCGEAGVDFKELADNLCAIHRVDSLEHIGNRGIPRASVGGHFDCDFGRDSIQIARDLGDEFPDVLRAVVVRLAALQGQPPPDPLAMIHARTAGKNRSDKKLMLALVEELMARFRRESEQGRTIHEHRDDARRFELESAGWGFPYYGATDSVPGFVTTAWRYFSRYPASGLLDLPVILDRSVDPKKNVVPLRESIGQAIRWIIKRLDDDRGGGFLWNQRMVGHQGISHQVWMDSGDSAQHQGAYAPVEVQGQTYDALIAAAEMFKANPGPNGQRRDDALALARHLELRAEALRQRFFRDFAITRDGEFETFAHTIQFTEGGLDRSTWSKSNPGRLLDTRLFDTDDAEILKMRDKLIERLFQPDMIGPFGLIRTLSKDSPHYRPCAYHNGSIWPTDNMVIAHGILRQAHLTREAAERERSAGHEPEARALFEKAESFEAKGESLLQGILHATADAKKQGFPAPEWIPGDDMPIPQREEWKGRGKKRHVVLLSPMRTQGWTVSAMWASASYLSDRRLAIELPDYVPAAEAGRRRGGRGVANLYPAD